MIYHKKLFIKLENFFLENLDTFLKIIQNVEQKKISIEKEN